MTPGRRRLVGADDRQGAARAGGLAAPPVVAGLRAEGGAPERAVHHARAAVPGDRGRVGGPQGRAHQRDALRRAAPDGDPAGHRGVSTGSTASSSARSWEARPPRLPRARSGQLRRDPFAMLPFCGYHMGDYFAHWLTMPGRTDPANLPRLYYVNWFRQDASGRFIWPGYGDNSRVLKWVFERVTGSGAAVDTPIGRLPAPGALDVAGVDIVARGPGGDHVGRRGRLARRTPADPIALPAVRRPAARSALWSELNDLEARLEGGEGLTAGRSRRCVPRRDPGPAAVSRRLRGLPRARRRLP